MVPSIMVLVALALLLVVVPLLPVRMMIVLMLQSFLLLLVLVVHALLLLDVMLEVVAGVVVQWLHVSQVVLAVEFPCYQHHKEGMGQYPLALAHFHGVYPSFLVES